MPEQPLTETQKALIETFLAAHPSAFNFRKSMLPHRYLSLHHTDLEDSWHRALVRTAREHDGTYGFGGALSRVFRWEVQAALKKERKRRYAPLPEGLVVRKGVEVPEVDLGSLEPSDARLIRRHYGIGGDKGDYGGLCPSTYYRRLNRALATLRVTNGDGRA